MTMGRKSNPFRETYLRVVALLETLHLLHAAELTEADRPGCAGEMATSSTSRMKPPSTVTLRDFDLNDYCDPEQPDDCGSQEDHVVREDAVHVSARFTTAGGRDWRDEALDEVRSAMLKHMQLDDAGDLEQQNVLNDSAFGFQIGVGVRKLCEQLTLEKTSRMSLLDYVSRQEEEIDNVKAQNEELRMRLSESVSREEEFKKVKAQNEELRMRLSESINLHEEEVKKQKAHNEDLRMRLLESVSRQEEEINNHKAHNDELRMSFSESVGRQEEVIKNLTAEKEELQCRLIDNFLAARPQRPLCDSMCSNSFRISAINEPGNNAISTHQYRAGFVDPPPLDVEKEDQPAEKNAEDLHAVELPITDSPPFPRSLKRKRTTRPSIHTRAKSASEILAINRLTSEEKHVQEARQFLLTNRSPLPATAGPSEHDSVDHAAPHHAGQRYPRGPVEKCDSTTWGVKTCGQQGKKIAPHDRHVSPWHEDIQSAEPLRSKTRPRLYQEYVCGIGSQSRKGTLGILKIYESGVFRVFCRCAERTCVAGAMWKPWDYVESHTHGKPANKWWDYIWAEDGGQRQPISRLRNMDMYAAHNKYIMHQDELKSARMVQLQEQKRTRKMMISGQ